MLKKILRDLSNFRRDRYSYERRIANQFEIGFQNLVLGANRCFSPRFRGFSQGEEDFVLYAMCRILELNNFLEFGVEDWRESNTRILSFLLNGNFTVWDGSVDNIKAIRSSREYFMSQVHADAHWITKDNIQNLISKAAHSLSQDFDVISIDLDGNDYWVVEAIAARPAIFICEYNSLFGDVLSVSSPYDEAFSRRAFHSSGVVYGASYMALLNLMSGRGYQLFHTTEKGNNMFFVRSDLYDRVSDVFVGSPSFKKIAFREVFVEGVRTSMPFSAGSTLVLNSGSYVSV